MQSNIHIHAEYRITLSDYRKAVYCALVIRRHRLFLCMLLILAAAFIYAVGRFSGLFPVCYPLVFVAAAELIWGLVLFAGAEKSVRAYMRTPNNYLGAAFAADFEDLRLHIQSPEHGVNLSIPWTKVYCVLEYSSFFSVYLTPQETCIIPRRALSADDDAALRALERLLEKQVAAGIASQPQLGKDRQLHAVRRCALHGGDGLLCVERAVGHAQRGRDGAGFEKTVDHNVITLSKKQSSGTAGVGRTADFNHHIGKTRSAKRSGFCGCYIIPQL